MINKLKNKNIRHLTGFTLVETLVAIAILSLSILATFTAVQGSLQGSTGVRDQIIAFHLAQEAMEFIKNVRDENSLKSISGSTNVWLTGLTTTLAGASGPCDFGKTCRVDPYIGVNNVGGVVDCSADTLGTCKVLNQDTASGLYGYTTGGTWGVSIYKREVRFTSISASEVLVTITMTWTTKGVSKTFSATELLFNMN